MISKIIFDFYWHHNLTWPQGLCHCDIRNVFFGNPGYTTKDRTETLKPFSELPVTAKPGSILLDFSCFFFPLVFSVSELEMLGQISYVHLMLWNCKTMVSQAFEESPIFFCSGLCPLVEIVSHSRLHRHKHRRNLEMNYINIIYITSP